MYSSSAFTLARQLTLTLRAQFFRVVSFVFLALVKNSSQLDAIELARYI
jgi:hypothetical protein